MDSSVIWAEHCQTPDYKTDPQLLFEVLQEEIPSIALPASYPSLAEVEQQAKKYSKSVFESWNILHHILCQREETIRRRWNKKSKVQREKVLLSACPDIPHGHRPDHQIMMRLLEKGFCQCCNRVKPQFSNAVKARNEAAFKCPQINLEDLAKSKTLLLFLNSRGHNLPHVFAHTDLRTCELGRHSSEIPTAYLHCHTMYLAGQVTEESYGKVVHWADEELDFGTVGQTLQFQPGHGLLVLEQQSRILDFLVKCCFEILKDISRDEILYLGIVAQPKPPPLITNDDTSYVQLSTIVAEEPYRLPTTIDTPRLLALIEARRNAAEDHIWEMREDPGYFASVLSDHHDHRAEILRDTDGKSHPDQKDFHSWDRILSTAVACAYEDLLSWSRLHRQVNMLESQFKRSGKIIDPQQRLHEKFEKHIVLVYSTLRRLCRMMLQRFTVAFACSHPMRARFARCPHGLGTAFNTEIIIKGGKGGKDSFEPLLVLVSHLARHDAQTMGALHGTIDEMQYYLDHDPEQKNVFSSFAAKIFSDLALITQIAHQIDNVYPWAAIFIHKRAENFKEPKHPAAYVEGITNVLKRPKPFDVNELVNPRSKKFYYPVEKAYNAAQIEAMQQAEANLDEVWEMLESYFSTRYPLGLFDLFKVHYISDFREIRRTADYVPSEKDLVKAKCVGTALDINIRLGSSGFLNEDSLSFDPVIKKPKIKTRGTPTLTDTARGPDHPHEITTDQGPGRLDEKSLSIVLSKRARKVLVTLFHIDATSDQSGEIPWKDFLHTMTSLHFNVEKLYGSVWQFTPTTGGVKRGVNVHEPHPSSKIPFYMARSIGRRLSRTYGWIEGVLDQA
ncbi:uncharacterized protein A1O9_02566 [Exophiala aquamarina CBS 119918]|uniref:Clr5 domain-containing protein n=1 Tax=Exophiala aquamarina CBS 119918 TaxID=1182545 RepID=A0A072PMK9_9EURO|nr:uncharacterized protein A1O9_02566 [Exophiala aquamarina CBS 119918]KEF61002.1 hypothetical protein A1O9_02566 [Exophiala aquamarina CBS 119918]